MQTAGPGSQVTVVITTRNRQVELRKALASALAQSVRPELLVMDDGSTDGTGQMIRREFPQARLERSDASLGYIRQRNRAARLAATEFIFSLDDDAVFSSPNIIETTLRQFDHPRIAAVAIPFVDINHGPTVQQKAPRPKGVYARYTYIGTAHALRRRVFLELGGYRPSLVHQGEEEDYCTRLLAAGYITRCGTSAPILHFESPRRSWARMDYYGARNKILYAWHNVPLPDLVLHLAGTTIKTLAYNLHPKRFGARLSGVLAGYGFAVRCPGARLPVSRPIYRLSRQLKQREAVPLAEFETILPRA